MIELSIQHRQPRDAGSSPQPSPRSTGARGLLRSYLVLLGLCVVASLGCTRAYYRQQADNEVYSMLDLGRRDPRWDINRIEIQPSTQSRFFDPTCPDYSPMPPDDPTAHQLMHCVDCKPGWPCWHSHGDLDSVENADFTVFLPYDDKGRIVLDLPGVIQVALVNSRDYQTNLEDLYLSALDVSFERFRFDTQFFATNDTFFTATGRDRAAGAGSRDGSNSILSTATDLRARKLFITGGEAVVGVANTLMWQFAGDNTQNATTIADFSLVQPLLRLGGRRLIMERLTRAERLLLGNIRAMERYRQAYYVQLASGRSAGNGPQRQGGLFGGSGLEGFTGVGAGGFGGVGNAGAGGNNNAAGFAGGAGAGDVAGYLGLLQNQRQIENLRANVTGLRQSLELLEAFYRADRIDRLQVDQARQALFTAQSRLLIAEAQYQSTLDTYKVTLGLPPCLDVLLKDNRLDQFELLSPEMLQLQTDGGLVVAGLWTNPAEANGGAAAEPAVEKVDPWSGAAEQLREDGLLLDSASEVLKLAQYLVPAGDSPARALRDKFRLYEARLDSLRQDQQRLARVLLQLTNAPDALDLAAPLQARAVELLPEVEAALTRLADQRDDRIKALKRLAEREEVRNGAVDRRAFDVAGFETRVSTLPNEFAQIQKHLKLPVDRWTQWKAELLQQRDRAKVLVEQMSGIVGPLRPIIDKVQEELKRPDRTELPRELNDLIVELDRLLTDPGKSIERTEQGIVGLESLLNQIAQEVVVLSEDTANMGLLQARAKLDSSTVVPIDLNSKVALNIAAENRLDWMNTRASLVDTWRAIEFVANALQSSVDVVFTGDIQNVQNGNPFRFSDTRGRLSAGLRLDAPITRQAERNNYRQALINYQQARRAYMLYVDGVSRGLRNTLRTIELNQINFELRRAAVRVALDQVELARYRLQEPPRPGVETTFGATTARDLVSALADLLQVQNDYLSVWVNYEQQRMELDLDLGTMQLDDQGLWIDPGPVDGKQFEPCQEDGETLEDLLSPAEIVPATPAGDEPAAPAGNQPGATQEDLPPPPAPMPGPAPAPAPRPASAPKRIVAPAPSRSTLTPGPVLKLRPAGDANELPEPRPAEALPAEALPAESLPEPKRLFPPADGWKSAKR